MSKKSSASVEMQKSEDGVFTFVRTEDGKYVVLLGNFVVLQDLKSFDDCKKCINANNFKLLVNCMFAVCSIFNSQKNEKEKV